VADRPLELLVFGDQVQPEQRRTQKATTRASRLPTALAPVMAPEKNMTLAVVLHRRALTAETTPNPAR
jgi:hypothetical protein